jgi:hypothetical protein
MAAGPGAARHAHWLVAVSLLMVRYVQPGDVSASDIGETSVKCAYKAADLVRQLSEHASMVLYDDDSGHRFLTLAVEVDWAATLVALAKVSRQAESLRRYTESAFQAYRAAIKLIPRTRMSPEQENALWDRLSAVRAWLESAGLLKD